MRAIVKFAKNLRKNSTEAEKYLWSKLRARQFGNAKFRRQQVIGKYIVDFVCFESKLVIEADGSQHIFQKDHDEERDDWLKSKGFAVLRFWDNEIFHNMEGVLEIIRRYFLIHPPLTPPIKGGG